jgi:hypothetical protein
MARHNDCNHSDGVDDGRIRVVNTTARKAEATRRRRDGLNDEEGGNDEEGENKEEGGG